MRRTGTSVLSTVVLGLQGAASAASSSQAPSIFTTSKCSKSSSASDQQKGAKKTVPSSSSSQRKMPVSTPLPAVKKVEKNFLGEEPVWESSQHADSGREGGKPTSSINKADMVDVDAVPLGIRIPWGDVQRQLQMFISNSVADPKAVNKGRIFLRDFDVLSNVTTIDEGLELLYYMNRLNYPANSRLELNLLSWLSDNVDCIYVDHVLDICRFALEQSAVGFWKRTVLCNDWFLPRLERLVGGSISGEATTEETNGVAKINLLKTKKDASKSTKGHQQNRAVLEEEMEKASGDAEVSRGEFALEDLVLIARVLSGSGSGEDTASVTGDRSTSNVSSPVRGGGASSSSSNNAAKGGQFNISIPTALTQDVATIQRRLRPVTEALTRTVVRVVNSEIQRVSAHYKRLDEEKEKKATAASTLKKKAAGRKNATTDVADEAGEDEIAALNDFFHDQRSDDTKSSSSSLPAHAPKFLLNPLLLSNIVAHILPLENGEEGKALKGLLFAIFDDASAIDCMVYLSALSAGGVLDIDLVQVLTLRMCALSASRIRKLKGSSLEEEEEVVSAASKKNEKKRKGVKKGALTRVPTASVVDKSLVKFTPPNIVFKLHREDALVDTVYISKALMLVMRLTSATSKLGSTANYDDDESSSQDAGISFFSDKNNDPSKMANAVKSVVAGGRYDGSGVVTGGDISDQHAAEVSSFLNDPMSPPMQLLSQLQDQLVYQEESFEAIRQERDSETDASARELAAGTINADIIQHHLDQLMDAVDAIELCSRYCRVAETVAVAGVDTAASVDGVHQQSSTTTSKNTNPEESSTTTSGKKGGKKGKGGKEHEEEEAVLAVNSSPAVAQHQSSPMSLLILRLENLIEAFVSKYGLGCQHASVLGHCLRIGAKLGTSGSAGTGFLSDQLIQRCEELSTSIASSPVMQEAGFLSGNPAGSVSVMTPAIPSASVIEREFKLNFDTTLRIVEGLAALNTFPPALVECAMAVLIDKRSQLMPSDVATMVYVAGKASKVARIEPELIHQLCHRLLTFAKFSRRSELTSTPNSNAAAATASTNRFQVAAAPVSWDDAVSTPNDNSSGLSSKHRSFQRTAASGNGILSPNEVAMLLYGLSAAEITPDVKLQVYLGDLAMGAMDSFTGSECCALLLVVHQLKLQHSALGRAVGQEVASAVPRLHPEDLIRVAQVMGELGLRDVRLMTSVANRLRQCKSLVQPIHLVSFAIALRETGFSPLFSRCGLEDILREIAFLLPNQATYLLAFVSPASQELLLRRFVRTEADLRKLTVDSLLTVYSAETEAVAPIRTHVLSLLEGKIAPTSFPPEVASVALTKAVALSNDSQQAFHNLTYLVDFIGPIAHRFQHSHTIALVDVIRRCIADSVPNKGEGEGGGEPEVDADAVAAVHKAADDVVLVMSSKSDAISTLEGATFKVHSAIYRFLGRRVVAVVDTMSAEQCMSALEIYCHGKIRDDRVVKALFTRLAKFARSISTSPRLTRSCTKLCEFYGAGWTAGLSTSLKLSTKHMSTSSSRLISYKGVR